MNLRTKRRITLCAACCFFTIFGIEYALIFPSLWTHLSDRLKSPDFVIAVVISAYSMTGIFVTPFVGVWADGTRNVRSVLLVVNVGEIVGSLLYFVGTAQCIAKGTAPWLLFVGRLLTGLGTGTAAVIMADAARSTAEKDRTPTFALLAVFREIGVVVGSSLNLGFEQLSPSFPLDGFSGPVVAFFVAYFNMAQLLHRQRLEDTLQCSYLEASMGNVSESVAPSPLPQRHDFLPSLSDEGRAPTLAVASHYRPSPTFQAPLMRSMNSDLAKMHRNPLQLSLDEGDLFSDAMIETAERFILSSESQNPGGGTLRSVASGGPRKQFIREDTVVLLAIALLVAYCQTALQASLGPLARKYPGYKESHGIIIYLMCGVEVLIVFAGIHILSRQLSDRFFLLVGLVFTCAGAFLWLGYSFIPDLGKWEIKSLPLFVLATAVDLFGMPMLTVCTGSLLSKVTSGRRQALMLSLYMGVTQLGCTLGHVWTTNDSLHHERVFFGVPCGLSILFTMLFLASFPQLGREDLRNESGTTETEEVDTSSKTGLTTTSAAH
ncbi:hypothetical protein HPB48_010958 [Haemaphysalis longicornis]|uniref:Uncharacterized protein n=1 Tax=Haemaphysalis longicornis TaxID=44386 RepID=A0A9J6GN89_HAELO|nr:hypothetical protein HPB48_010958 [Haemaphysalis longicornis]